jgi:uncharacterized glyoxalase superfamily protein PhnB
MSASLSYDDAAAGIDFLCRAFGFEVRIKVDGDEGAILHSELVYGEALVMVGSPRAERPWRKSPKELGGMCTQSLMLFVDDVDAHAARAKAEGATIASEPTTVDYGEDYWIDRGYEAVDIGGHHWYFVQRVSEGKSAKK